MVDISQLEKEKEEALVEKRKLSEKRRTLADKMKTIKSEIKNLRAERNKFNKVVQSNKQERAKSDTQIKALSAEIASLIKKQTDIPGSTSTAEKEYKELDWKYQTQSHSPDADRRMSQQLSELGEKLRKLKGRDSIRRQLREKEQALSDLKEEQRIFHMSVMANAQNSEVKHEGLLELYKVSDELEKQLGKINEKSKEFNAKLDSICDRLPRRPMPKEKIILVPQSKGDKILEEKVKVVKQKLKSGGKLTTDDLRVIQEANIEI